VLLALAGLGYVVRGLHAHERVHLYERPDLLFSKLDNAGRETPRATAAAVTVKPAGSMISVRMKSPGWDGLVIGMVLLLVAQ
jgi:hypothetical protein